MSNEYFNKSKSARGGGAHENRPWSKYWKQQNSGCNTIDTLILTATGLVNKKDIKRLIKEAQKIKASETIP